MATARVTSTFRTVVAVLGTVVLSLLFVAAPGAQADDQDSTIDFDSNEECLDIESAEDDWHQVKVEAFDSDDDGEDELVADTYGDGTLMVTITDVTSTGQGQVFDWTSNIGVDAVVVKGGPKANLYDYTSEESTGADGLHAPFNEESEAYYDLSNISFCYDVEVDLTVDKLNDADQDGTFSDSETAPAEGADVDFEVTVEVPESSDTPVDLSLAEDAHPTGDENPDNDATVDLFEVDTEDCGLSDDTVIAVGDSVTCTFTLVDYAPAPGESLVDTVTVEGHEQGDSDNSTSAEDTSTVDTPAEETPPADISLEVDKVNDADQDGTFSDTEQSAPEGDVAFQVTVINPDTSDTSVDLGSATDAYPTGDGDTSNDTTVDLFGIDDEDCGLSDDTVLEPGESETCTFTIEDYGPAPGESIDDTVTVEGHAVDNPDNTTSDQDTSTVETPAEEVLGNVEEREPEADTQPAIAVTKTALVAPDDGGRMMVTFVPGDGDDETVSYRYTVTNTGDTTLDQVTLTDDVLGAITLDDTTLAPGASTTVTATHVLSGADAVDGEVTNVATAVGTTPNGEEVSASDDALVLVTEVLSAADERPEQLPATGVDPVGWATLAIGFIALGGAALVATRQRAGAA